MPSIYQKISSENKHELEMIMRNHLQKPITERNISLMQDLCCRFLSSPYYSPHTRIEFENYLAIYSTVEEWDEK